MKKIAYIKPETAEIRMASTFHMMAGSIGEGNTGANPHEGNENTDPDITIPDESKRNIFSFVDDWDKL